VASIFSKIIAGELPARFVWRDASCVAFLSIRPLRPGHVLVVPREEIDHWIDLDVGLLARLAETAQAIGKAGGLNDQQSAPAEVFVYRYEDRHFLEKLGVDTTRFTFDKIPTIYHVNLRDPAGMLLASGFQMHTKDVMYVANAKVVDYYKLLTLIK